MLDDRTELLITRKLDGEIREDELLELNKRLIRSPEARALLEEYERNDALAASTLRALLGTTEGMAVAAVDAAAASPVAAAPRGGRSFGAAGANGAIRYLRYAAGGLAAIAAVLAFTVLQRPALETPQPLKMVGPNVQSVAVPTAASDEGALASMIDGRRDAREQLDQDVMGVYDEKTRSWYMLELERKQTKVTPVAMSF
jgi:anti-sigma factor RsiW